LYPSKPFRRSVLRWRRQLDGNLHPDKGAEDLAIEVVARSGAQ